MRDVELQNARMFARVFARQALRRNRPWCKPAWGTDVASALEVGAPHSRGWPRCHGCMNTMGQFTSAVISCIAWPAATICERLVIVFAT